MKHIQTITVGAGGAANIEFTSIPQTYTDLKFLTSLRSDRSAVVDIVWITFNGSSTNQRTRELYGTGTSNGSGTDTALSASYAVGATATSSIFSNGEIYVPNYAGATNKSSSNETVSENNSTTGWLNISNNLWSNTAAITSVKFAPVLGTIFTQYSSISLYGIKNS